MSYREYVIAAYLVFAIAMLWDWLWPKLQIARALRMARQQARRRAAQARQGTPTP
ncbi:heme exporter protein CcmD [Lysobacteraceae bacterium NML120232]|nr:heme exporter protein CcmD [Xanthomonadaceae bacterium NML08-0793]PJK13342.1 heme exporter protein CcmD [Xanthomonadaceae bacterium NML120232]